MLAHETPEYVPGDPSPASICSPHSVQISKWVSLVVMELRFIPVRGMAPVPESADIAIVADPATIPAGQRLTVRERQ
jgi:hypothetical protein